MKKLTIALMSILLIATLALTCVACTPKTDKNIVYLGDSIIEGLIGPSPVAEREGFAYANIIGERNNYKYINRAVGGHTSADMLELINRPDEGAYMTQTHIKQADIIAVSIIGNDFLMNGLNELFLEFIDNNTANLKKTVAASKANFDKIIAKLKALNPNATLLVQTIYNPFYMGSTLLPQETMDMLIERGYDETELRALGKQFLDHFNGVIIDYASVNEGAYQIIDIAAEFERIHTADAKRGSELISPDWVHPSNEGHAVIADLYQAKLEELGLANTKKALAKYKKFRNAQLDRLYGEFEFRATLKKTIDNADSCAKVTEIYFNGTAGSIPNYIGGKITPKKGATIAKEFKLDLSKSKLWGYNGGLIFNGIDSKITFRKDGTMTIKFVLSDLFVNLANSILGGGGDATLPGGGGLPDLSIFSNIGALLGNMFPGIDTTNIPAALETIKNSLGVSLIGLDTSALSGDALTIPKGFGIEFNGAYTLKTVKNSDGKAFTAVHVGTYTKNTESYVLMSIDDDNLILNLEIAKMHLEGIA